MDSATEHNIRKLAILAGQGWLPAAIANECQQQDIPYVVVGFSGQTPADLLASHPHQQTRLGAVGQTFALLKAENVSHVVMAGGMQRPPLTSLRPDKQGLKILGQLAKRGSGDNSLLSLLVAAIEEQGFSVIGAHEVLGDVLMPEGILSKTHPTLEQCADLKQAFTIAKEIGRLDIGQAVVVQGGQVLAVESIAGTKLLLSSVKGYANNAVLVKAAKPGQEQRVDLPAIGPETVLQAAEAGIAVIAGEAEKSLLLQGPEAVKLANQHGICLLGISADNT